jgi:hypothetical protein
MNQPHLDIGRGRQRDVYLAGVGGVRPTVPVAPAALEKAAEAAMSPEARACIATRAQACLASDFI